MSFDFSSVSTAVQNSGSSKAAASSSSSSSSAKQLSASEQSDRFLKLLVTQMQNQDPLNPMDNAQITTQMAQISTVSGIDQLNESIKSMSTMMLQSQSLEGASLVGKDVLVPGNKLSLDDSGVTRAGFELDGAADNVTVTIKNGTGLILDTVEMGALESGRHSFGWKAKDASMTGLTFTVNARSGTTAVASTALAQDRVVSVSSAAGQLSVELQSNGIVKYSDIKAVS
ncbi:MAG: flagellar hook assembly protein FlgD [Burkholderiales bacterium]|nr:flagellar hook assembly protein FlgD [Burkholderiales bacterium]